MPNPDHKTSPLVSLTTLGKSALVTINEAACTSNEEMMREFTAENAAWLGSLLRRFTEIIKTAESSQPVSGVDRHPGRSTIPQTLTATADRVVTGSSRPDRLAQISNHTVQNGGMDAPRANAVVQNDQRCTRAVKMASTM